MPAPESQNDSSDSIDATAAQWLARCDRGLSPGEQVAYAKWLGENSAHRSAVDRLEKVWGALDQLEAHPLRSRAAPNPDLLAPQRKWVRWAWAPLLAAAAAVAVIYFSGHPAAKPESLASGRAILHPGAERLTLEDGSIVELNTDAKVEVQFSPAERRVQLVRGEAYFKVAKNPSRPFVVSANQVTVNAVGTAFTVGLDQRAISVLVTEGRVRVDEVMLPSGQMAPSPRELSSLQAGQQGQITLARTNDTPEHSEIRITELNQTELDRALAWQGPRLEFVAMPMKSVVAEFNRYNRQKLVVHDANTAAILVGGTFRADNVQAFIRLLDTGFGVSAFPHGDEIILRKTR